MGKKKKKVIHKIKILGIGDAGNNAVGNLLKKGMSYKVGLLGVNTNVSSLNIFCPNNNLLIGENIARGYSCGADPELGKKAAWESKDSIEAEIRGYEAIIIACGMGGGAGSGASIVVARIAKKMGIYVAAVVTRPFHFEPKNRLQTATDGINELKSVVDELVEKPNDDILALTGNYLSIDLML